MNRLSRLVGGVLTGLVVTAVLAQRADGPDAPNGRATRPRLNLPAAGEILDRTAGERVGSSLLDGGETAAPAPASENAIGPAEAETRGVAYLHPDAYEPAAAVPWLEQAAAAGRPFAQIALAGLYANGEGVPQNPRRAFELYLAAAEQGIAAAQIRVGMTYLMGLEPVERDAAAGRRWLIAAARQEDGGALGLLSQLYRGGAGIEPDTDLADELMMRAAEVGHPIAQRDAARPLLYGDVEERNPAKGMYLLEKAAEADEPTAAYALGREYLRGSNIAQSFVLAGDWLTRAADRNAMAALRLSEMYASGLGFPQDVERARTMLDAALERASPGEKNIFAWELSVSTDSVLRNGALAVEIMESLLQDAEYRVPNLLDTLAAAYAEAGRFDEAVDVQLEAIAALPADAAGAAVEGMHERVELYRSGQAYRE